MDQFLAVLLDQLPAAIVIGSIIALTWWSNQCPNGGTHEDETIASSSFPPFAAKHRCTKCGRVMTSATYAL